MITVAQDGSGDFSSIQSAIDSAPSSNEFRTVIYIKNGRYTEKIFIKKSNTALVGEDKNKTTLVYAELRKNWRETHEDDYGAGVVNIRNGVTDILFSELTIYNSYGDIYEDRDHAFAIRAGEGVTRIIIDNCRIISGGGDTMSLWNKEDGMYYHSDSYFEGWVDYVCPRGYCFIENSSFYGHNLTASLWHDGNQNENQKFVLKNCRFDGIKGFPLGRFHWDAQFYMIDCTFSENMADKKIFFAPSNPPRELKWGEDRQYYFNCHGQLTDYDWHQGNLYLAPGNPKPEMINASWTFDFKWDPVKELESFYQSLMENK
ncbi:MAG TPA: pectinesterase family protein [Ignavibacteriaceae bacterium]